MYVIIEKKRGDNSEKMREQLNRDTEKEGMTRIEESARREKEFKEMIDEWNKLDSNAERRQRYYVSALEEMTIEDIAVTDGAVAPEPLEHRWWRQMMRGDFLDVIFDCPYDIHELTSSRSISTLVKELSGNQKEVLYFRAVWQWTPQKIAAMRGQTDRNIRKVYDTLIARLRRKLYEWLLPRYEENLPLTFAQREFMASYGGKDKKEPNDEASASDKI